MESGFRKIDKRGRGIFFAAAFFGLVIIIIFFLSDTEAFYVKKLGANLTGGYALGLGGRTSTATIRADQPMESFRCPALVTLKDQTVIRASVANPGTRQAIRILHFTSTDEYGQSEDTQIISMAPGEVIDLTWEIPVESARYGFLVLARVFLNPYGSLPSEGASCGILVLNTDKVSGTSLLWGTLAVCITGMVTGILVSVWHNRPLNIRRWRAVGTMMLVAFAVTLGLSMLFFEFWRLNLFVTMFVFLMVPVVYLDKFQNG